MREGEALIASVYYGGRSKLINVNQSSSYADFVLEISGTWDELILGNFECIFSVGGMDNCFLCCDADLKNMVSLCQITSQSFVIVHVNKIDEQQNHDHLSFFQSRDNISPNHPNSSGGDSNARVNSSSNDPNHPNSSGGDSNARINSSPNDRVSQQYPVFYFSSDSSCLANRYGGVGKENIGKGEQAISGKKRRATNILNEIEFTGDQSIPIYDMCPVEKKKAFLSDEWAYILKDGIGMEFSGGADEFRRELIKYMLKLGYKFKYKRNDSRYIHAVCTHENCDWFIKSKRRISNTQFVVYNANLIHKCVGSLVIEKKNRLGTSILSSLVTQKVKSNPTISGRDVIIDIKESYGFDIPYWKAWRAIEAARSEIFGGYCESYDQLRWYCDAIKRTNPNSVVDLQKNPTTNRFERLFISFKACNDGFLYCRPMLFIDGTFMKGRSKGTILSATAKDGDNGLFPVAFAIVSAETKDNWTWFLVKLRDFVKHDKQVMYISDRNKGLMCAFNKVFDRPVHFYCMYHLLTNLKTRFSGRWTTKNREEICDLFKECAYAPTKGIFDEKVAAFVEYGGKTAEKWLNELPYEKWAVSYSPDYRRYGEMTSNAAESFNSWIKEARGLPITFMIDSIRKGLCRWFVERRQASKEWTGALCASKEDHWNHLTEIGKAWSVVESPNGQFEVSSSVSVLVDLNLRTCSCYQWQIRGFPCAHAVAVIRKYCSSVYNHIEPCFLAVNYRQCYKVDLIPIPETERFQCKQLDDEDRVLPPILKSQPGRPKKERVPSFCEFRRTKPTVCSRCGKTGRHDKVTCSKQVI